MVICVERGADLHTAQLMPLPLTVSCSSKIQIGFTFLVPAHPGSPGQRAVKWVCVVQAPFFPLPPCICFHHPVPRPFPAAKLPILTLFYDVRWSAVVSPGGYAIETYLNAFSA